MRANDDANAIPFDLSLPHQIKQQVGYQCLPLDTKGGDGFYYALLTKQQNNNRLINGDFDVFGEYDDKGF